MDGHLVRVSGVPDEVVIDDVRILALLDAEGPFFEAPSAAFPGVTDETWDAARPLDPAAYGEDGGWRPRFHAFALEASGRLVLVDAGVGPADAPAAAWAPVPGRLPAALEAAGIAPGDVGLVVLTHLHADHVGWLIVEGDPLFAGARHVVQRLEVERANAGPMATVVAALAGAGLLDEVEGERDVAPGLVVMPTPGHTSGHQSVLAGRRLMLAGDVLVHAVQLLDPTVRYHYEDDPRTARDTRVALLERVRTEELVLAVPHLGSPFVAKDRLASA